MFKFPDLFVVFISSIFLLLTLKIKHSHSHIIQHKTNVVHSDKNEKLELVFLFHRHGDRTPYVLYPNDPNNNAIENYGIGRMINKGKRRLYHLGQFLSKRYYNDSNIRFPIEQKSPKKVYARSSGSERCLQSISSLLAGMFPPEGEWIWDDKNDLARLWQPFPIQTVEFDHDSLLNPNYKCPMSDHVLEEIYRSADVRNFQEKYRDFLQQLADWTGFKREEMNIVNASYVFDIILSEKNLDLSQPKWLTQNVWNTLKIINDKVFELNSTSRNVQRFLSGSMFGEMFHRLDDYFNGKDDRQLYIYSTHDTWLSQFLAAMNVYDGIPPSLGSTIMLEVYKSSSISEPYFKGFYLQNTETEQVKRLQFPSCTEPCTIKKFHDSIKDLIINDPKILDKECFLDIKKIE